MKDQPDYSSMEWDGKRWQTIDPETGERAPARLVWWDRVPTWAKWLIWAALGTAIVALAWAWDELPGWL